MATVIESGTARPPAAETVGRQGLVVVSRVGLGARRRGRDETLCLQGPARTLEVTLGVVFGGSIVCEKPGATKVEWTLDGVI